MFHATRFRLGANQPQAGPESHAQISPPLLLKAEEGARSRGPSRERDDQTALRSRSVSTLDTPTDIIICWLAIDGLQFSGIQQRDVIQRQLECS